MDWDWLDALMMRCAMICDTFLLLRLPSLATPCKPQYVVCDGWRERNMDGQTVARGGRHYL